MALRDPAARLLVRMCEPVPLFLNWLGRKLGVAKLNDWYRITKQDFIQNGGRQMREKDGSPAQIVMAAFPKHDWKPWLFPNVPAGFWADPANRRRYIDWLAKRLCFRKPEDWLRIRSDDLLSHHGKVLLRRYRGSVVRLVMDNPPELGFKEEDFEATLITSRRRKRKRASR